MLTREDAVQAASAELARDTELLGTEIVAGEAVESPHFWVFHPNSALALRTGRSSDSLSSRLPPIVVDRRNGRVTRPVAAGRHVRPADLGPGEWFLVQPRRARRHDALDGLGWSAAAEARAGRLRHFRVRRGGRDAGDVLTATIVALSPAAVEPGLRGAGLEPTGRGWWTADQHVVRGTLDPDWATIRLDVSGNGRGGNPWTITETDLAVAEQLERSLADEDWIRFWDSA